MHDEILVHQMSEQLFDEGLDEDTIDIIVAEIESEGVFDA